MLAPAGDVQLEHLHGNQVQLHALQHASRSRHVGLTGRVGQRVLHGLSDVLWLRDGTERRSALWWVLAATLVLSAVSTVFEAAIFAAG